MKHISLLGLLLIVSMLLHQKTFAQNDSTSLEATQEVWPELNIFYKINDKFRLYSNISATKSDESSYSEGAFAIYVDYFGLKAPISKLNFIGREEKFRFRLRAGYLYSKNPPSAEDKIATSTFRFQTSNTFSVTPKFRAYYKGRLDLKFSDRHLNARYVPRLMVERDFKTEYLTFSGYFFAERYLDFQSKGLNRTRIALGANLRVSSNIDFETYYLYQFSNGDNVPSVNAIGTKFKFYFARKEKSLASE